MTDKILGVLGGMGPLASAHFMVRLTLLTPADHDQDHIPAILWSDPRVPPRPAALQGTGPDPLPWLLRGIDGLRAAGCGAIAIPCNTVHTWYEPMARHAKVPVLHIVEATATELRRIGVKRGCIGLMATAATLTARLYQDRLEAAGWHIIEPTPDEMERLVNPAIALVKSNHLAESHLPLATVANSLASRGASAVVLGCTEIPLGIHAGPTEGLDIPVVDTVDALARAAITWARGL